VATRISNLIIEVARECSNHLPHNLLTGIGGARAVLKLEKMYRAGLVVTSKHMWSFMTLSDHTWPHQFEICLKRVVLHRSSTLFNENPDPLLRASAPPELLAIRMRDVRGNDLWRLLGSHPAGKGCSGTCSSTTCEQLVAGSLHYVTHTVLELGGSLEGQAAW